MEAILLIHFLRLLKEFLLERLELPVVPLRGAETVRSIILFSHRLKPPELLKLLIIGFRHRLDRDSKMRHLHVAHLLNAVLSEKITFL